MKRTHLVLALLFAACRPIIGDACTVNTDCGPGVCINRSFAPGGVCSVLCTASTQCPAGSVCVGRVLDFDTSGCLLTCSSNADCRDGYECRVENNSATKVCVGTIGIP